MKKWYWAVLQEIQTQHLWPALRTKSHNISAFAALLHRVMFSRLRLNFTLSLAQEMHSNSCNRDDQWRLKLRLEREGTEEQNMKWELLMQCRQDWLPAQLCGCEELCGTGGSDCRFVVGTNVRKSKTCSDYNKQNSWFVYRLLYCGTLLILMYIYILLSCFTCYQSLVPTSNHSFTCLFSLCRPRSRPYVCFCVSTPREM